MTGGSNSIGLKRGTVQLAPYDPAWARAFQEERVRLKAALGSSVHDIAHVGSTSIPGLAAKPIIDIIASVDNLAIYRQLVGPLESLGYEFMPERVFEDRVFFPKGPRENRTHHLSLVIKDSAGWRDPIRFRDYVRAHEDVRAEYQVLKEALAVQYPNDRASYTKAKDAMIKEIMGRAV
ncbi:MAG TPA: GrpB family protein [Candidatus Saccharimonadia bacterium]|nr:GrpB family protein [Candidatus Saccharimonadia bacterium]